jgi:hypothetical protein
MDTPLITVAAIFTLAVVVVFLPVVTYTFQRYRKKMRVRCPGTGGRAWVDINAFRAALSSALGKPRLRIKNCSLWPKRKNCDRGCVKS